MQPTIFTVMHNAENMRIVFFFNRQLTQETIPDRDKQIQKETSSITILLSRKVDDEVDLGCPNSHAHMGFHGFPMCSLLNNTSKILYKPFFVYPPSDLNKCTCILFNHSFPGRLVSFVENCLMESLIIATIFTKSCH